MFRIGVYSYDYMDEWKQFNKTSLSEEFYSNLNMEDITDADYMHVKRVCKDFEIKNLLLADVFQNFRKICLEIYQLDPVKFLSALGLAW